MTISVGDHIPEFRATVDRQAMKPVALLLRDPNPIHWDLEALRKLAMGDRPVNQGPVNVAYVFNALIAWTGDPARVRRLTVRFLANVLADDVVIAGGRVRALRGEGRETVVDCEVWLHRADGVRLLYGEAEVRM